MKITAGLSCSHNYRYFRLTIRSDHKQLIKSLWGDEPNLSFKVMPNGFSEPNETHRRVLVFPSVDGKPFKKQTFPDRKYDYFSINFPIQGNTFPWLPKIRAARPKVLMWDENGLLLLFNITRPLMFAKSKTPKPKPITAKASTDPIEELKVAKEIFNESLTAANKVGFSVKVSQKEENDPVELRISIKV